MAKLKSQICAFLLAAAALASSEPPRGGTRPTAADDRALNLGFETGTLADWTATGDAFRGQPMHGDTVYPRRKDMKSRHAGEWWVGTYEVAGDAPRGTLTSVPFEVTQPWASFLLAGGDHPGTRVEVVLADTAEIVYRATGFDDEGLRPVIVDLRAHVGQRIFLRLVDQESGGWGHVNFDDFLFHAERPSFPKLYDPEAAGRVAWDEVPHAGLTAEEAAKAMTLPEGFQVTVFASEPDVRQPIALALDDRGRVWIAEAYSYPTRQPEGKGRDRILIFEDTDGDGRFDRRTVFCEGLNLVSGLEVGFGGVWVGAAPWLLFIPDRDHDDRPDGPPDVVLDGWGCQDTHETLNAFIWGPDGWLYGCHGVFTQSLVGRPGAGDAERTPMNAGVWRYHPTRRRFEVFAEGTSNPWGVDFDDWGQAFATACVIPHLYHLIPGARYQRQAGAHFNPYVYDDLKTIADHVHWAGDRGPHAGNARSDRAGGGHAHCGAMVYLGDNFPAAYRNRIFMSNIHGQRINMDVPEAAGSGYVGRHGPDFLLAHDRWSQVVNLRYGPDGSVYVIDWYDRQECHDPRPEVHDRSNGRIFRVAYGKPQRANVDLAKQSDEELAELALHPNDWYVRHARRLLAERAAATPDAPPPKSRERLAQIAFAEADVARNLRGLWALHVTGGLTDEQGRTGLAHAAALVRAWTVRLLLENALPPAATSARLLELARSDPSSVVRLSLASSLQRLPPAGRWELLEALAAHAEDAGDANLPLVLWYAAEASVAEDPVRGAALASTARLPRLREFIARRLAAALR
ncbi:MAG: dehydrogenase [Planctomycetes bacterium]|nr:dehydrogenase [Planctomycetota bacterium]